MQFDGPINCAKTDNELCRRVFPVVNSGTDSKAQYEKLSRVMRRGSRLFIVKVKCQ